MSSIRGFHRSRERCGICDGNAGLRSERFGVGTQGPWPSFMPQYGGHRASSRSGHLVIGRTKKRPRSSERPSARQANWPVHSHSKGSVRARVWRRAAEVGDGREGGPAETKSTVQTERRRGVERRCGEWVWARSQARGRGCRTFGQGRGRACWRRPRTKTERHRRGKHSAAKHGRVRCISMAPSPAPEFADVRSRIPRGAGEERTEDNRNQIDAGGDERAWERRARVALQSTWIYEARARARERVGPELLRRRRPCWADGDCHGPHRFVPRRASRARTRLGQYASRCRSSACVSRPREGARRPRQGAAATTSVGGGRLRYSAPTRVNADLPRASRVPECLSIVGALGPKKRPRRTSVTATAGTLLAGRRLRYWAPRAASVGQLGT